jgi:hypothetical protein
MSTTLTHREPVNGTALNGTHRSDESGVLVAFKTPMTPRPSTAYLRGNLSLRQSVEELRRMPPKDEAARRLIQQLERETSGPHDFLVLGSQGELTKVDPERTKLGDIAVPREVRTPRGTEKVPTAAFEVQAYAPVGRSA